MTMDFFFPEDHLDRMTPEETRITSLSAEPYPDGRRLHVNIEMTPFQKRPHLEITLKDGEGGEIASASVVEPLTWKIEFTMHLPRRAEEPLFPRGDPLLPGRTVGGTAELSPST
jgi:hypothetical protein